jgi:PAS domain S-box-containing protein
LVGLESSLLERVDAAVMAVDLRGRVIFANRYVEKLYGWPPDEIIGESSAAMAHVPVPDELAREIMTALTTQGSWEGTFDVRRKDGTLVSVHAVNSPLYDASGQMVGVVTLAYDATRERTEQFLAECAVVLGSSLDYERNLRSLANLIVPHQGDICVIDAEDGNAIRRVVAVHAEPAKQSLLDEVSRRFPPDPGSSHPAVQALREGAVAYVGNVNDEHLRTLARDDEHFVLSRELGVKSYMCVPLVARGNTLGAVTVMSCSNDRRFDSNDVELLREVGHRAAIALDNARLFVDQQRARAEAEAAAERLSHLQTLATALSRAVTVDEVTKVIAAIATPHLSTTNRGLWLLDEEGQTLELVEGFDLGGGLSLRYASIATDANLPANEVFRTREPVIISSAAERDSRFPELEPIANEGASFAAMPLIAEERTLGVLALGFEVGHIVQADELRYLMGMADQCAQALARALLYDRERQARDRAERDQRHIHELNRALQTSLLPPNLPEIPGVELEARYQPALAGLEVGGDFYDVFDTGGDWAVVIGDVCGKGPEAAAVTAIARWTIRSVAIDVRQPTQVLRKVNDALVRQQLDDRFCTIAYARVVPTAQGVRISVCRGGHPAPLLMRADGTIEAIGMPGSLIGILPEVRLWEETAHLTAGDAIVFYTDGVTEARRDREQFGEAGLRDALTSCARTSAPEIADAIEAAVLDYAGPEASDDIAILVLHIPV